MESDSERLRREIIYSLPTKAFERQPQRILFFIGVLASTICGFWIIVAFSPRWYMAIVISVFLGNCYAMLVFFAHDTLHGSVVKSHFVQNLIGYIGLSPFLFTPALWRVWHNQVHHGHTNIPDIDPDALHSYRTFKNSVQEDRMYHFLFMLYPGSHHRLSAAALIIGFTAHAQVVLRWVSGVRPRLYQSLNRSRAKAESLGITVFWIILGLTIGLKASIFAIIIPMLIGNAILMSYIFTNHQLRPVSRSDDSLENSMSVTNPKIVDLMHLNFSHHVEHHLFPEINSRFTPLVRKYLIKNRYDRYLYPSHLKALYYLYKKPILFKDDTTLTDPSTRETLRLQQLEQKLRDK